MGLYPLSKETNLPREQGLKEAVLMENDRDRRTVALASPVSTG